MFWRGRNKFRDFELVDKMGGVERIITNPSQWFTEQSVDKLYPLGTKLVVEDMVFRYAQVYASSDSCWRGRGAQWFGRGHGGNVYIPTTAMVAAAALAKEVTLTTPESLLADEFENGRMALFPSVWTGIISGRIKTNDPTSEGSTKFYLKEGIQAACGPTSEAFVYVNTYKNVGKAKTSHGPRWWQRIVGGMNVNATLSYFIWLQTWGPWMGQYGSSTYKPGTHKYQEDVYFDPYGAIVEPEFLGTHRQRAGFYLGQGYDGTDLGEAWTPMIMLQISP